MNLIEQIEERLSIFKNFCDDIRIVDPVKKIVVISKNHIDKQMNKGINKPCYTLWKKHSFCENCVSMRAFINNDTIIKIEYDKDKIKLITAAPFESEGKTFIVEFIKDISKNGSVLEKINNNCCIAEKVIDNINENTVIDSLTGVYNRSYIDERLPVDINYSKINTLPLSIIMTEIDFLEEVDKKYGHIVRDEALVSFSMLIKKSIRNNTDWVGRYSARKFIIVLNETVASEAYIIAENIRKELENAIFNSKGFNVGLTSSLGVYGVDEIKSNYSELLAIVNKNLYKAIISGSNRTVANDENGYDVSFTSNTTRDIKLKNLNKQINELRETLNEVCSTIDEDGNNPRRLIISQCLDELIVQYMKELNNIK